MYPLDYIYTPPEIIAREVKKEFSTPKIKTSSVPASKKTRSKLMLIEIVALTSPLWAGLALLCLAKAMFGL